MPNSPDNALAPHRAVLLLGPTGSGKTPLGDLIASRGLWNSRCLHFDFGANLRRIVERDRADDVVSREDIEFLRDVLQSGRLLEDDRFPLAERILRSFLARNNADARTLVVLNGLPRHQGQAAAVDSIINVEAVISLACTSDVVLDRIRTNVGGDRTERDDDDPESIRRKLALFAERTAPLIEHYGALDAGIETVDVSETMTAEHVWALLTDRR
ncbi:MAG: nucleoside monophosphate kinase [Planctomycetes bacterium]|nr:nucleoside monophosphate kinase [Planctomycetota bacterium]